MLCVQFSHENLCNCEFVCKLTRAGMEKYKEVKNSLSVLLGICRTACVDHLSLIFSTFFKTVLPLTCHFGLISFISHTYL